MVCGSAGGIAIGLITEYYTGSTPIVKIAESGQTGPATVMITGLSVGMQSVVAPIACLALSFSFLHNLLDYMELGLQL